MNNSYIETMALRTCHCDLHGRWRPSAILEAMQETAGTHCARLGIGRDVTDGLGIVWVLSRSRVALERVPKIGETVSVETYPLPPKHLFYPRVNVFRDSEGGVVGSAGSLWVLLDVRSRRIVNNDVVTAHLPDNAGLPAGPGAPGAVRPLPEPAESVFMPAYSDFDVNGHVNNTKYLDWCCSALGFETMARTQLRQFDICYETEILPGSEIRAQLAREGDRFTYCGFAGDKRCFSIGGTLIRES